MMICMAAAYVKNVVMPNVDLQLTDYSLNLTTTMYYKDASSGEYTEMQTLYGSENRVWVKADEMPKNLLNAAVAVEDKRFYDHHGVDWLRTMKGIINMFSGQDIQGGSTITQQLIKNLTDEDEVTVKRKITEIFRALEFEKKYSKQQILEWYLNYIYLGERCSGVYTASYVYFGKHVSQLDLAECASLIGITNNPSKYDPYSSVKVTDEQTGQVKTAKDFNKERQELILNAMCEQGYITQQERDDAIAEELHFVGRGQNDQQSTSTVYSWYVDAVISDVIKDLKSTYNLSDEAAKNTVYSGGLEIYTCMDPTVQAAVDAVYQDTSNLNYTSGTGQKMQSAITMVDNETGNVVALAGGMGEKTSSRTWNRATQSLRPPGSSIKPLSVYSPAIELGYVTPISIEVDSPYKDGWPVNSYNSYRGKTTVTDAVKNSVNTIAVKVLANDVTPEVSFKFMQDKFKIRLVESRTVGSTVFSDIALAPLALGGLTDGVSTYDMAAAYSVFPREGTYINPRTYSLVLDSDGNVLLDNSAKSETILSQRTVYYMNNMLEEVVASGTGTKANFSGQAIAGKTGTTTSRKDLWFVGYTPYYTAAVWTGYDKQEKMSSGIGNPSAVLWNKVMQKVHAQLPYKDFDRPDSGQLQSVAYCTSSGLLATRACSGHTATASLFKEDVPTKYCNIHTSSSSGGGTFSHPDHSSGGNTTDKKDSGETTEEPTVPTEPVEPPAEPIVPEE